MATAKKVDETPATLATWGDEQVEVFSGLTIVDKSMLVDKPFCVTGARTIMTKATEDRAAVEMVQVECELDPRTKEKVYMQDSSIAEESIKATLTKIMLARGWNGEIDQWVDFKFLAPQGLRVSAYKKKVGGKDIDATTYYLTTVNNGRS